VDESRGLIDSGLASENARQKGSKEADPRPVVRPKFTSNWVVGGVSPGGGRQVHWDWHNAGKHLRMLADSTTD